LFSSSRERLVPKGKCDFYRLRGGKAAAIKAKGTKMLLHWHNQKATDQGANALAGNNKGPELKG
jgi:hypothetical protein